MLTLITTTRNRHLCFNLLEKWISAQTVKPDQWLVINDGTEDYEYHCGQEVVKRKPVKQINYVNGKRTRNYREDFSLIDNWLCALPLIKGDKIIVAEDDDWLHPTYIETMSGLLDSVDLAGVKEDIYHQLPFRRFKRMHNQDHASLGATGFRSCLIPQVKRVCELFCVPLQLPFIDMYLWAEVGSPICPGTKRLITNRAADGRLLHLGFKNMPGEKGLGIGHSLTEGSSDPSLSVLAGWIGRDVQHYARLFPVK